jgi:RNA polymerase sigma-32 factor
VVSPPSAERPSLDEALDEDEKLEPRADSLELTGELSDSNWPVPVPDVAVSTALTPLSSSDPVALYLNEIKRYPLLTREQEQDLARRYHESRDPKAAEALVTSNLRFVVKVAAEYTKFGAKLIDLIQEGNVGLMHAVRDFNPYKGTRLITYAVWWIRGYIQEYLMRQYSLVRIGTTQTQRRLFYRLQKERDELERSGVVPDSALLSTRLGVTKDEVEEMQQRLGGRDLSLSQPAGEDSSWTPLDQTASADEPLDEQLGRQQLLDLLGEQISKLRPTLNEKELYLLENRLLSDEPLTLQEIGEQQGVTREAVRQTEARLIGKIRKLLQDQTE